MVSGFSGSAMRIGHGLVPHRVVSGVADQHRADELLALGIHHELLVNLFALVEERIHARARRSAACASPIEPTSTPSSLSLVLMSAPAKASHFAAEHARRGDARHLVARRHEAEHAAFVRGALADGEDGFVGGAAVAVDADAAARRHFEAAGARQLVARTDAGGDHHDVGFERAAVGEVHAMARGFAVVDARRCSCRCARRRRAPRCASAAVRRRPRPPARP